MRRACWIAAGVTVASLASVAAYSLFGNRLASPVLSAATDIRQFVDGTLQLAAVAFAAPPITQPPATLPAEYFSPNWVQRLWPLRAALVIAAGVVAAVGLVWEVRRRRMTVGSVLGPLACLASVALLAVVIGFERGTALDQRYIILGATLVFTVYLCLSLVRHQAAKIAGWMLAIMALVFLPWNAYYAISFGEARQAFQTNLVRDIRGGTPVDVLGTRYYPEIWGDPQLAAGAIREMSDDHIGPFAHNDLQLNDAPPVVASEEPLSLQPAAVHNMTQVGDYWQGAGNDSFLVYRIDQAKLSGVRLNYSLKNATGRPAYFQLAWSTGHDSGFDPKHNTFVVYGAPTTDQPQQLTAWIDDSVDMLKVTPDTQASSFKLDSLVLLLSQ
jgi:hypothetical protein